jgi:hypothetical protein
MEAHRRVEFTGGSRAIATDKIDSNYYEAGGDPFVAAGIVGLTYGPLQHLQPRVVAPTTIGSLAM